MTCPNHHFWGPRPILHPLLSQQGLIGVVFGERWKMLLMYTILCCTLIKNHPRNFAARSTHTSNTSWTSNLICKSVMVCMILKDNQVCGDNNHQVNSMNWGHTTRWFDSSSRLLLQQLLIASYETRLLHNFPHLQECSHQNPKFGGLQRGLVPAVTISSYYQRSLPG